MDWNKQLWHDRKQCCVNDSGIAQDASLRKMLNAPNFLGPPNERVSAGRKDGGGVDYFCHGNRDNSLDWDKFLELKTFNKSL